MPYQETLPYVKIVNGFIPEGATAEFDDPTSSMFAYNGNNWIGYDSTDTIALKTKYYKDQGMAGYMFWSYNGDDNDLALQKQAALQSWS